MLKINNPNTKPNFEIPLCNLSGELRFSFLPQNGTKFGEYCAKSGVFLQILPYFCRNENKLKKISTLRFETCFGFL